MDLSSTVSAMSAGTASNNGGGGGAVACPVCTLYLREGISLQKHLDTHPKEQVIEALIRASSGGGASALFSQSFAPQQPQPQTTSIPTPTPTPTQTPTPTPVPALPMPTSSPGSSVQPTTSPSPHVPHAQSPYPIGPIFECPPINAMIPPPQFTSFSYQQFVNNGTMMIPAQYAMAQAQPPQTSQMMQMLYSPYGMYHQQQIPTVQMISAPTMMPTTATTLPTTVPAVTTRMRPATNTSNVTLTAVNETTTTASPPRSTSCTQSQQQMQTSQQQQQSQEQLVIESPKHQIVQEINPDRILPDLEMPASPESTPAENEHNRTSIEHREQLTQNNCVQEEQRHVEHYHREDSVTLLSNTCEENVDDKIESILPDIEDNEEIESLIVRNTDRVVNDKHTEAQELETDEQMETSNHEQITHKTDVEGVQSTETKGIEELDKSLDSTEVVMQNAQMQDEVLVSETTTSSSNKIEIEQLGRLLVNMESDYSNVETSNKVEEEKKVEKTQENVVEITMDETNEKPTEEDESTSVSYHKASPEPLECKIIVAHEDTDVSSVASEDFAQCDMGIQKIISAPYQYKYSQSAPTSPISKKKHYRSLSRASIRSDFDRSNENICSYPVGFEATTLADYLKDNYNDEDMELEEPQHTYLKESSSVITEHVATHPTMSTGARGVSILKARRSKVPSSPISVRSVSSYGNMEEEEEEEEEEDEDSDADSCISCHSNDKDDEEEEEEEENIMLASSTQQIVEEDEREEKKVLSHNEDSKVVITPEIMQLQHHQQQEQPADFRSQNLMADHYSVASFPLEHHQSSIHQQQQQSATMISHETYPMSSNEASQNLMNITDCVDPTTSTDSKSYSSSSKSVIQKPSTELLNISEDAHAGPMNVFEFDGLQILVPSTFISESSQKAVSGTSQQSMLSSENGAGNDEEVKSVNMRADETMPARGELSEQESNGCTEQSAWQLYMGQESSRMSTSYDLMARESWEESEGSDREDNNGGPLLDSRSLATHFTSSLFLDRDRKTPTRRVFKCSHCSEVFDCPKERRVHSTMVHKEAGPSSCSNDNMDHHSELKDIKLLEGRANVFEEIFVPGGMHMQQTYQQQPLLHQLQPPPQHSSAMKADGDVKVVPLLPVSEVICTLCNQRFSSEKSLQIHHRRMHVAEPTKRIRENAKCQICNEEFTSVANFNLHLKIHPLECGQCGKYFYRKQNFKLHMKRHLGIKPFRCTVCDKAFLTKQKLDEHTNGHTGNAPVKCNLCNETFRRYSNLTQHKNRHHLNIKKKLKDYICHCGEVFHTKKKLAWHKETHDEKPKACTYCNERFIHMASLTRHMRRAHNRRFVPDAQRENENVECPICKCIYLRSSLAVHMRVHNGERPYECQVCSKAFSTKWNLQLHKWTHAARSTKPFKCNQCSAAFYRHSDYTAHMNSHRNVRPYTCNYCGAQFIRKYNCLRHVKEHEENKAYTCDVCNKTFHRSYYLKEHLRVHSGARPYSCHICGKSSSTKSNHNKHVRIHHAREPVNTEN